MSLPVPLTVRVGDRHVTREVQSLSFRREAVGGVRSISFSLARSLTDLDGVDPLAKVYVYDARSAYTVAEGRLADTGRGAGPDGQRWDCVAFGPAQHASDITLPLIYIDRSLDSWRLNGTALVGSGAQFGMGAWPGTDFNGLLATWADGTAVVTGSMSVLRHSRLAEAGMELGYFAYQWDAGKTEAAWVLDFVTSTEGGTSDAPASTHTWNTAGGSAAAHVVTNFSVGRNLLDIRTYWNGGAATVSLDRDWAWVTIAVEATRLYKDGTVISAGYDASPQVHQIVWDLLGRCLPEFDGANATVAETGTFQIQQLTYPDGVTPAQVFGDLMALEPAYRWYTTPSKGGADLYGYRWELWPTTVRYEATLDDGGSFPLSTQTLYNQVSVRWRDANGRTRSTRRTLACDLLDDKGLIRRAQIDLGGDMGDETSAIAAGDAFLAEHNVPRNSGTLNVGRPIRDVLSGRMVDPWEIEAGELIRIRGVEAYPDAFNADTNDGQGVFRIHAVDYTTEENMATLALDSDPRETEDALVKLMTRRERR